MLGRYYRINLQHRVKPGNNRCGPETELHNQCMRFRVRIMSDEVCINRSRLKNYIGLLCKQCPHLTRREGGEAGGYCRGAKAIMVAVLRPHPWITPAAG